MKTYHNRSIAEPNFEEILNSPLTQENLFDERSLAARKDGTSVIDGV
ncbi:hypothetical protein [Paraburkholderia tagetis]|uniref:Uncharacterized protein n=1 Tax=Paraburkholderia tagetis TaxID=2913261 RepID=A0A9X1RQ69_9BURK|nr:hypothetical protein [Paraburkholderia tagetis]MCG5076291.1 hypothetical protein [Paraburkholderia tagetis]